MKFDIKTPSLIILLFINSVAFSQARDNAYLSYIEQYHQFAEKQQKEHGIPASIVLAQGLLESGAGLSDFAIKSNNHFGIKCNDWLGDKIYHDDDQEGECFRKYDKVIDSYEDHALFLKNRPRYGFLFDLKSSDYEGWAHGLKKAGYATDPTYAFKLISIIEVYDLHRYDIGLNFTGIFTKTEDKVKDNHPGSMGSIKAITNHEVIKVNGVKFIISYQGDTYALIGEEFKITNERIRSYNEVNPTTTLNSGTRVFLAMKKEKAPQDCETHIAQMGESMHSIAQDYGIKIESIYKLNRIPFSEGVKPGKVLKLR